MSKQTYDTVVVGAGFSGAVIAERLASLCDEKVLVIEKRDHLGGNAYDFHNEHGILQHKYGPHIFHTNLPDVWNYLAQFTQWNGYVHRVLAHVDGMNLPIPINLNTVKRLLKKYFTEQEVEEYFHSVRLSGKPIRNARDVVVSQVGELFYEKFFKNYTKKQWGVYPEELAAEVTQRIPVRFNSDDRYFSDTYQGLPALGYSVLFDTMLSHLNITVLLNTDYKTVINDLSFQRLVYTGPVDYFFDFKYGKLPYRSLRFEAETLDRDRYQEVAVINYPNEHEFTRITEFKHMTLQQHLKTTIVREYPQNDGDPYYPIPMPSTAEIYEKYRVDAEKLSNVHFMGRLAEYRYINMDQAVKHALDMFHKIACI